MYRIIFKGRLLKGEFKTWSDAAAHLQEVSVIIYKSRLNNFKIIKKDL